MRLPLDIRDISATGKRVRKEREERVRVAIFVDPDAPDALIDAVKERFQPQTSRARLHIAVTEEGTVLELAQDADAVLALVGSGTDSMRASLGRAREADVPAAVLALSDERSKTALRMEHPVLDTLVAVDPSDLVDQKAAEWLADRLSGKRLALAGNFVFMRRAVAEEAVKATAFQNGVVGVVAIIPGADMPVMTANQAKMLLQIAAAYGEPLGAERMKELLAVVGGGFALRTIAREMLAFVPGLGWAMKGGIAYAGTVAMGRAAIAYFERGADLSEVLAAAASARDRAMAEAKTRLRRGKDLPAPDVRDA